MLCKCCNFLAEGIEFRYNAIALCNRVGHKGGGDIVVEYYDDKNPKDFKFNAKKYVEKRNEIILKNTDKSVYPSCEGCMELRRPVVRDVNNLKISNFVLHHWTKCNSHCLYCYTNKDKAYFNSRKSYKVYPFLKELAKNNSIEWGGIVNWAGGEVSCLDEFEKVSAFFDDYDYFSIFNSSCIKYEKTIARHLKENKAVLIVSVDAGTKELHSKIKQVNSFDNVWRNLARYSQSCTNKALIYAKYIVLPNINDNKEEVDKFLKKVKENDIHFVLFDLDIYYFNENRDNIDKNVIDIFYYAFNKSKEYGLNFLLYSNSSVLFTNGKYKDDFWSDYLYDEAPKDNVFNNLQVVIIDKNGKIKIVPSVKQACYYTKIPYKKITESCKKYKKGHPKYINNFAFALKKDYLEE